MTESSVTIVSNIIAALPPTLVAIAALIAALQAKRAAYSTKETSERVEEKVDGTMDSMMKSLESNLRMVSEAKIALAESIRMHEVEIEELKRQLDVANAHIQKLILPPEHLVMPPEQYAKIVVEKIAEKS